MAWHGIDGPPPPRSTEPPAARAGAHAEHHATRSWVLGTGTLACPRCDLPVALGGATIDATQPLDCPYCRHRATARCFLSLAPPTRPTRVELRLVATPRERSRARR